MGPCDECLCRDLHKEFGDEEKDRTEGVGWDVETQQNPDEISGGSQRAGWGSSGAEAKEGPVERCEKRWA